MLERAVEQQVQVGQQPILEAGYDVSIKQFTLREITYRRFMAHPLAKWGAVGLALIIIACYGAPLWHLLFPNYIQAPEEFSILSAGSSPSVQHLFGTDSLNGHDIFSQVLYGGRLSLIIGLGSMLLATSLGVVVGAFSGYFGGLADALMMGILFVSGLLVIFFNVLADFAYAIADPRISYA